MPCFSPLNAYRSPEGVSFSMAGAYSADAKIKLPCGRCIGCRLEHSRQWAARMMHEASLYDYNCFVTLTYDNQHLPNNGSLKKRDVQLFLKRLRKKYGPKIRFYCAGEYGERDQRPHYHLCLFNHYFHDAVPWKRTEQGHTLYRSAALERLWTAGHSSLNELTFESAAYAARYILKKVKGGECTRVLADENGRYRPVVHEYATMSRGGRSGCGIAGDWIVRYRSDVYDGDTQDFIVVNGVKCKPPRFYDETVRRLEDNERESSNTVPLLSGMDRTKLDRVRRGKGNEWNNTRDRLRVRETVLRSKISTLKRGL